MGKKLRGDREQGERCCLASFGAGVRSKSTHAPKVLGSSGPRKSEGRRALGLKTGLCKSLQRSFIPRSSSQPLYETRRSNRCLDLGDHPEQGVTLKIEISKKILPIKWLGCTASFSLRHSGQSSVARQETGRFPRNEPILN